MLYIIICKEITILSFIIYQIHNRSIRQRRVFTLIYTINQIAVCNLYRYSFRFICNIILNYQIYISLFKSCNTEYSSNSIIS